MRWVVGIDLESGSVGDPEPLAPTDLSDRAIVLCTGDDAGWVLDAPFPGPVRVHASHWDGVFSPTLARMRLTRERACVERALGSVDGASGIVVEMLIRPEGSPPAHGDVRTIDLSVASGRSRYALRCATRT
jgi:hypothetical protein